MGLGTIYQSPLPDKSVLRQTTTQQLRKALRPPPPSSPDEPRPRSAATGSEAAASMETHGVDGWEYGNRLPTKAGPLCVFIHDPRIRGPNDAYLYSVNDHKSGKGKGGGVGSPFGRDTFYWPDMRRTDVDGTSVPPSAITYLPSVSVNYDMDPRMLESDTPSERAVYHLWYSLVRNIVDIPEDAQSMERSIAGPQLTERPPFHTVQAGPRTIWIDSCPTCERATRVEPRLVVPRSRGVRSSSNLRYSFPLGDINPDHGRREVYTVGKTARQEQAWRPHETGEENERPPRVPRANRGESLPRRSTAPPALGRVTGTTRRVFGSDVAKGLFAEGRQGNLHREANNPFVKTERKLNYSKALGGSFGDDDDNTHGSRVRRYSAEETSLMAMTSPSFLVCDTESANIPRPSPTSSTSWPSSATPSTASPAVDDDVTLGFSTAYPFGAFADGM
eukprot:jgi/Undpi1/4551/HiC_scaffold_18.g07905.m1